VDPIKIRFTGSPTLRPTICGRPVVFQPLGAPNQYRAPNLRSSWPCSNTTAQLTEKYNHLKAEYAQLKASHAQQRAEQRAESEQLKASQAQQKAEYEAAHEQQKAAYEQLREMLMNITNSGTCAPNRFWPYNHQPPPGSPPPPSAPSLY